MYGNVPYSQALKGSGNPTPAYDDGLAIYQALFREIDAGIALIKGAVVTADNANKDIWKNDIVFGDPAAGVVGNVPAMKVKWAKFGNTLKLRLLIHLSQYALLYQHLNKLLKHLFLQDKRRYLKQLYAQFCK